MNPKRKGAIQDNMLSSLPKNSVIFPGKHIFEVFLDCGLDWVIKASQAVELDLDFTLVLAL